MRNLKLSAFALLAACLPFAAAAHQPRLVESPSVVVTDPEVSKAYYGRLEGEPHVYRLTSSEPFRLYLNVLVPDVPGAKKDVSAGALRVGDTEGPLGILEGLTFAWEPYHEEFGDDDYFKGPEFSQDVPAGEYEIRVWSSNNDSAYVLAVGDREEFPPGEIANALRVMPTIKERFFGKPRYAAYLTPFLLGKILPPLAIVALAAGYIAYRRKKKMDKTP